MADLKSIASGHIVRDMLMELDKLQILFIIWGHVHTSGNTFASDVILNPSTA